MRFQISFGNGKHANTDVKQQLQLSKKQLVKKIKERINESSRFIENQCVIPRDEAYNIFEDTMIENLYEAQNEINDKRYRS